MLDNELQEAYRRLGLQEDVTREELDRQFSLLLKRGRSLSSYDEDFRAFKTILDARDQQEIQDSEDQRLAKWGRMSNVMRSLENFMRLYKVHMLVAIIIVAGLIFGGRALYNYQQEQKYLASLPPLDAEIVFLGSFQNQQEDPDNNALEQALLKALPSWNRVEVEIIYLPLESSGGGMMDTVYMQKAIAELSASKPDILVMDEGSFAWLGQQGGFQDLKAAAEAGNLPLDDARLIRMVDEEDGQQKVAGLDFSESDLAASLPVNHLSMIAALPWNDKNKEKAMEFVEQVAKNMNTETVQ